MKKILYSGVILIVIGLVGSIASFAVKNPFHTESLHKNETVNSNGVDDIEVASSSIDVNVTPSKQKKITVEFVGKTSKKVKDNYNLIVKKENEKLKIELKRKDKMNFNFMVINDTRLLVKVPEKTFHSISIQTSSGDIQAKNLNGTELTLKSSSGDIQLEGGIVGNNLTITSSSGDIRNLQNQAGNITMNTSSGDIITKNGKVEQRLVSMTSSGDIQAEDYKASTVSMETNSGDIMVSAQTANQSNFTTSSGSAELNNITGVVESSSISGDIVIYPNEKITSITADTSSGDVEVKTRQRKFPFAIQFKGNSGDGRINLDGVKYIEKSEHTIKGQMGSGTIKLNVSTSSGDFVLE